MEITPGTRVEVTTALGEHVPMRALSGPEQGRDFEVVWVTTEREFDDAQQSGEAPEGIPWPIESLRVMEPS